MERNEYLEMDGLFWESPTHEWFHDKTSTDYARKNSQIGDQNDSLDVMCFVVRNKQTGEYDRVMMDKPTNQIIYSTPSIEAMGVRIDALKASKRFDSN